MEERSLSGHEFSDMRVIGVCLILVVATLLVAVSGSRGQVTFNGLPVPGAIVIASHNGKTVTAITDLDGFYSLPYLEDGIWHLELVMPGFAELKQDVQVGPTAPESKWELKVLPLDQVRVDIQNSPGHVLAGQPSTDQRVDQQDMPPGSTRSPSPTWEPTSENELTQTAVDGFLVNGSVDNAAASPVAQSAAFGNNRAGGKDGLYTGGIGVTFDNSALDASPFSLTGQSTPYAAYNRVIGLLSLSGPVQIPHLLKHGPNFFLSYQWSRNTVDNIEAALMPDAAERSGIFPNAILDPLSSAPFPGNVIPPNRISPQARALLKLYPLPNSPGTTRYNYQASTVSHTHQDALQSRFDETLSRKDQLYGRFGFLSTRSDTPNVFGFLDTTTLLGMTTSLNWLRRLHQHSFLNIGYQFSWLSTRITPFFANRENVSGDAGILGNNQDPVDWGPPTLNFASGIAALSDSQAAFNRNETNGVSYSMIVNRRAHNITFGADFRRQEFNYLSEQDPRGTFTFTGTQTGSDFADFLLGIPDTSSIASGNPNKYFRQSVYDAYISDDWRIGPGFTAKLGVRWDYGAPITELFDRLVNLDVTLGFKAVAPVLASNAVGPLTGAQYPSSLIRPDKTGFQPRVGLAWRPLPTSSLVIRAGYGIYYDTSVYQALALQMAEQPPLSKTFSVQASAWNPLTLANGFNAVPSGSSNTFAIDPNLRVGYAQNWQLSVQRDLPGSMQLIAMYMGIKGTHGVQDFLPNTFPIGGVNPCPQCPAGFEYLTSNGNSTREAAEIQLRRRLHNGFTGILLYTFSKSIDDDAALGGHTTGMNTQDGANQTFPFGGQGPATPAKFSLAQNWLDLRAERGLSTFNQRHLLSMQLQYTSGMGLNGGTLLRRWKGTLFKEWTVATQITAGSGLAETPIYFAAVPGTGMTGTIRPDFTGAPLSAAPPGLFLNPAAYVAPPDGEWGNVRRGSVTGPTQFGLNASLGRTFRVGSRLSLDLRIDSTNALNYVNFVAWNTVVNGAQFGLPMGANPMRSLQTTARLRF